MSQEFSGGPSPVAYSGGDLQSIKPRWGWLFFLGLLFMAVGIGAISYAVVTSVVAVMMIGILLLVAGVFHLFAAIFSHGSKNFFFTLLAAMLSLLVGGWLLYDPVQGAAAITFLFAFYFVVSGLLRIIGAITYRDELNWGWLLFSGILSLVLGGLIYAHWPYSGLWIIGIYVGVDLFLAGWSMIVLAFAARNA